MARNRIELVEEFLDKVGRFELDSARSYLAEDAVMSLPYVDEIADITGREVIIAQIAGTVPLMLDSMTFTYHRWYECPESNALIGEYSSKCPIKGRDAVYENDYVGIFNFRGDEITLYKEYLNPAKMAAVYS